MYDYIDSIDTPEINEPILPNFDRFTITKALAGGYLNNNTHQVTYSGPAWSSILTGVWSNQHQVNSNNGAPVAVEAIFKKLFNYSGDNKTASIVAWTPINSGHMKNDMPFAKIDIVKENGPDDVLVDTFITDASVAELDDENSEIRFIFTHLDEIDHAGHSHGWGDEYEAELIQMDLNLGKLLDAVERREANTDEEWLVLFVSDHGHTQAGGHGGDSIAERTSVIGTNRADLMNEFFTTPAHNIALTDNDQQNALMGYPGITSIAPTVIDYLGYAPKIDDYFSSPSLINTLGAYKLFATQENNQDQNESAVQLIWQQGTKVNSVSIYRNGSFIKKLTNNELTFTDTITAAELGREGYHTIFYTVVADVGTPVASSMDIFIGEPVALEELLAEAKSSDTFNAELGQFSWFADPTQTATYQDGPFVDAPDVKSINIDRDKNGYLTLDEKYIGVNEASFAFWIKVNGDFSSDPNIISNKDWMSGNNPGFTLTASGLNLKINVADSIGNRVDSKSLQLVKDQWMYIVFSFDLTADRLNFYLKSETDNYQSTEADLEKITSIASDYPLNIGEGGDGLYNKGQGLNINIADLLMFDKALTPIEARALQDQSTPLSD